MLHKGRILCWQKEVQIRLPSASALMKQGKGKQEADASPLHPEPVEGWGEDWVRGLTKRGNR